MPITETITIYDLYRNGNVANSDTRAVSYISMPTSTNLDMMDDDTLSDVISLSDDNRITGDLLPDGVRRFDPASLAVSQFNSNTVDSR